MGLATSESELGRKVFFLSVSFLSSHVSEMFGRNLTRTLGQRGTFLLF